jgi:hypothetical protein
MSREEPSGNCGHSPRKVLEMNSDTWFPERLISDRWLSSLFNILLNCNTTHTHIHTHTHTYTHTHTHTHTHAHAHAHGHREKGLQCAVYQEINMELHSALDVSIMILYDLS